VSLGDATGAGMVAFAVGEGVERDMRAGGRQRLGDPEADSRGRTGDNRNFSLDPHANLAQSLVVACPSYRGLLLDRQQPGGERPAHGMADKRKRRPREEGVKSLRQASYRQETYRAVRTLYKTGLGSPSPKSGRRRSPGWSRVPLVNRTRICDNNDTPAVGDLPRTRHASSRARPARRSPPAWHLH